nr:MAG TPA: hypothetical protein [Caudoviricetes sp.]
MILSEDISSGLADTLRPTLVTAYSCLPSS